MNYKIIKSKRKTISIIISTNNEIIVKAPYFVTEKTISEFINSKQSWIDKHIYKNDEINNQYNEIISKNKCLLYGRIIDFMPNFNNFITKTAKDYLVKKTYYLANKFNFNFSKVNVRFYKSRWGTCNSKNEITLNKRLVCLNEELIDFVILHELCHTVYFNHKQNFHNLLNSCVKNANKLKKELNDFSFINKIEY